MSLSTSSIALASKNTQDFTNVITFGDSFANGHTSPVSGVRVNTYAQTLAEQLGFAFTRNENNFASGGHSSKHVVGGTAENPGGVVTDFNPGDINTYLTQKGKFGTNDLVIYDPLSSEYVFYGQIAVGNFLYNVFGEGTGISDVDSIIASGKAVNFADIESKVIDGSLAVNTQNFPILFSTFLNQTENNAQSFAQLATLNGANYILVGNHYNDELRQSIQLFGVNFREEFYDVISREIGKAQIRGALKVPGANIIVWDEANLIQELVDNPSKYLTLQEQALGNYISASNRKTGVFDASAHATQPVNNIKRQFIYSVITSPTLVSLLRESPLSFGMKTAERNLALAQGFSKTGQVENNIAASADAPNSSDKFAIQVFGDFGKSQICSR